MVAERVWWRSDGMNVGFRFYVKVVAGEVRDWGWWGGLRGFAGLCSVPGWLTDTLYPT